MAGIVGSKAARASGGTVSTVGQYTLHSFTTTGANTFTPATTGFVDVLLIGGGGGAGTGNNNAGGGGAGATLFKKMISVTASTPYPISVGAGGPSGVSGTPTTFIYSGITTTASGGGFGGPDALFGYGANVPTASGGGCGRHSSPSPSPGGTGAGVLGIGYPGGGNSPPSDSHPTSGGGGGGAGGAGVPGSLSVSGPGKGAGGPGVPITYFTGISTDMASVGGAGHPNNVGNVTSPFYGSGGTADNNSPAAGRQGVAYIRYI